jgi:hypothetical protein
VPQALVRLFRLSEEQQLKVNEANIGTTGLGAGGKKWWLFLSKKIGDFLEIYSG